MSVSLYFCLSVCFCVCLLAGVNLVLLPRNKHYYRVGLKTLACTREGTYISDGNSDDLANV